MSPQLSFVFDETKAAQAAAQLLLRHGRPMGSHRLLKLLYLADRRSLVETGYPITGDKMVCMEYGPVLSGVYDALKGSPSPIWSRYITSVKEKQATLSTDKPEIGELSSYDIRLLAETYSTYGDYTFQQLKVLTHEFPEWKNPGKSSTVIPPEEILRAEGKSADEVERLAVAANAHRQMAWALGRI